MRTSSQPLTRSAIARLDLTSLTLKPLATNPLATNPLATKPLATILLVSLGVVLTEVSAHARSMPSGAIAAAANPDPATVRRGLPGRRVGGATRASLDASCNAGNHTLMALGAKNNLNLTLAERPTLMFFIPKGIQNRQAEFQLRDQQGNLVHRQSLQFSPEDGFWMVDLQRQSDMPALDTQANYQWSLGLSCPGRDIARGDRVEGWVRRVTPQDAIALANLSLNEQAQLERSISQGNKSNKVEQASDYAKLGLWPDAIAQLCNLVTGSETPATERDQARKQWKGTLSQLDLPTLVQRRLRLISPLSSRIES